MLALPSRRAAILTAPWVRNDLWRRARAVPSLDLRFAENRSLVDATTGRQLIDFTRASSATYVDSDGLIKTATTNLLLRSEEFDNASWAKVLGSITANAATGPNGVLAADAFIPSTTAGLPYFQQNAAVTVGAVYTWSVFLKAAGYRWVFLDAFDGANRRSYFDLQAGIIGNVAAGNTSTIESFGNGWYRCTLTRSAGSAGPAYAIAVATSNGGVAMTGDGISGIYAWGAQLEQSSTVGEYIPTGATINSAPRFDHNPTTGECLGLLVEEQRTNEVRNSSAGGVVVGSPGTMPTSWSAQGNANGWTREVVGSGIDSQNGLPYVDVRLYGTSTTSQFSITFLSQGVASATNGQTWSGSFYYRIAAGSLGNILGYPAMNMWNSTPSFIGSVATSNPTVVNSTSYVRNTGSGAVNNASTAFLSWGITFVCTIGTAYDFTIRIAAPQLELGAFATSWIPNTSTATAVTRSADVASISGSNYSAWFNAAQGTLYADVIPLMSSSLAGQRSIAVFSDGTYSNSIGLSKGAAASAYRGDVFTGGSGQAASTGSSYAVGQASRLALGYASNDANMADNGQLAVQDNTVNLPTGLNRLDLRDQTGASLWHPTVLIKRLTYWPQRLSNSTLQELTR